LSNPFRNGRLDLGGPHEQMPHQSARPFTHPLNGLVSEHKHRIGDLVALLLDVSIRMLRLSVGRILIQAHPGANEVESRTLGCVRGVNSLPRQPPGGAVLDRGAGHRAHFADLPRPHAEAQGQGIGKEELSAQRECESRAETAGDRLKLIADGRVRASGQIETLTGASEDVDEGLLGPSTIG